MGGLAVPGRAVIGNTVGAEALGEVGLGAAGDVGLDRVPVPLVVPDLLAR